MRPARIVGRLATVAVIALLSYGLTTLVAGTRVPYLLHLVVVFAICAGHELIVRGRLVTPRLFGRGEPMIREDSTVPDLDVPDRPFAQMRTWEERLELVRGDGLYFRHSVAPLLGELIDERLRLSYGIDRQSAPEQARKLIGDQLWTRLESADAPADQPPARAPGKAELAALVTEMEKLWTRKS